MKHHQSDPCWRILLDSYSFILHGSLADLELTQGGFLKENLAAAHFPIYTHNPEPTARLSPRLNNFRSYEVPKGYLPEHQTHCRRGGHSTGHQNLLRLTLTKTTRRQAVIWLFAFIRRHPSLAFLSSFSKKYQDKLKRSSTAAIFDLFSSNFISTFSFLPHRHGFSDIISGIPWCEPGYGLSRTL